MKVSLFYYDFETENVGGKNYQIHTFLNKHRKNIISVFGTILSYQNKRKIFYQTTYICHV